MNTGSPVVSSVAILPPFPDVIAKAKHGDFGCNSKLGRDSLKENSVQAVC
jgi:hypothetical protein